MNKQNVLEDTLLIEWYEVNKTLFNRKTVGGTPVTVRRDVGQSIKKMKSLFLQWTVWLCVSVLNRVPA